MHLIEEYALACGVQIDTPYMDTHIFPLKSEKYITVQNTQKFDSRDYNFWGDVIDHIKDDIKKAGFSIVQVGTAEERLIDGVDESVLGKTTLKQTAWIIQNADLHMGVDSFPVHAASAFRVPVVGLYSNMHASQSGPYWSPENEVSCIESDRGGRKPSYAAAEPEKTINMIAPEKIANEVLRLLGRDYRVDWETIFIGSFYKDLIIEVVPDFVIGNKSFNNGVINVRMDLHHDEKNLFKILPQRKCSIIANKPIELKYLKRFKSNIQQVDFEIDGEFTEDYIDGLKHAAIPFTLSSRAESEEELRDIRMKFFDYTINKSDQPTKEDYDFSLTEGQKYFFQSNKFILSKGEMFSSQTNWKNNRPTTDLKEWGEVVDEPEFWEEADHFRIFKKTK